MINSEYNNNSKELPVKSGFIMNENLDPSNDNFTPEELDVEKKLRPLTFDDFTGQDQVLENLLV